MYCLDLFSYSLSYFSAKEKPCFFFQAEDCIRDAQESRGLGDVYKRQLLDELGIEYVFAGDFHGYAQTKLHNTTYIVTGGGGAHLNEEKGKQFHHALVIRVTPDSFDKRIIAVSRTNDLEDRLEKLAISEIWPWIQRHAYLTVLLNAVGITIFIMLLALPLIRRTREKKAAA